MMKIIFQILFAKVMVLMSLTGIAGTIDTVGQEPYEQCGYCHEYDGNSLMGSYPKLAAQVPGYIKKQLEDFRSGKRKGQMQATAELLNDGEIEVVARYFGEQKLKQSSQASLSKEQQEIANKLYFTGDKARAIQACSSCHGDRAQGIAMFPRLAGQHAEYLADQLNAFKAGTRVNDTQGIMQKISRLLKDTEIESLSEYLSVISPSIGAVSMDRN